MSRVPGRSIKLNLTIASYLKESRSLVVAGGLNIVLAGSCWIVIGKIRLSFSKGVK